MNSFSSRFLIALSLFALLSLAAFNTLYPYFASKSQDKLCKSVAAEIEGKSSNKAQTTVLSVSDSLDIMNRYQLAWCYLSDKRGKTLQVLTPLAPNAGESCSKESRSLEWRGQQFYESVAPVGKDLLLHLGFNAGSPLPLSADLPARTIPFAALLGLFVLADCIAGLIYAVSVKRPLREVLSTCRRKEKLEISALKTPLPLITEEVLETVELLVEKCKGLEASERKISEKEAEMNSLKRRFESDFEKMSRERGLLQLKDAENNFVERLGNLLEESNHLVSVGGILLSQLRSEMPDFFEYGLFYELKGDADGKLVAHAGFKENQIDLVKSLRVVSNLFKANLSAVTVLESAQTSIMQFRAVAVQSGARQIVLTPLIFHGRTLALMVSFFQNKGACLQHICRVLERAARVAAKSLHSVLVYEEQVKAARTDDLTGLPNKAYLPHILSSLASAETRSVSMLLVEGNEIRAVNEKYGRAAGNAVIRELGDRISSFLGRLRGENGREIESFLLRYHAAQFLIILKQVNTSDVLEISKNLRQSLEELEYPLGVGSWTVFIGISSMPEDGCDLGTMVKNTETALAFARGQSKLNRIVSFATVPGAFRSSRLSANLGGSLGVYDPPALLQSLSLSRKSGVLTVADQRGKAFWCYLESGKPTKARLGKFSGNMAVIEFLALFDSGDFAFSDISSVSKETLTEIEKVAEEFLVTSSLERLLMDGALARDHFNCAREIIKEPNLYVWSKKGAFAGDKLAQMKGGGEHLSVEEERVMREIMSAANGKSRLKNILDKFDDMPTHAVWRGAALLVQHDIVSLKKIALGAILP